MNKIGIKNDAGLMTLVVRLVIGWTYFSAFWRRTILADKLDPDIAGYLGIKFNHFLPNALGIKPIIRYLVENPDTLWISMVAFTIIEGIVGLFLIFGFFTRLSSIGVFALAMGILLGSGWLGTTCIDEWQIGVLGVATGFMLFLTGSGKYSIDYYLMKKEYSFAHKKWFKWIGSGKFPLKEKIYPKVVLIGSLAILGLTLMTNQVFHGGVWGTLHNKSVKPKLEITEASFNSNEISFNVFRTEGVDVYGAWIIGIKVKDRSGNVVIDYSQEDLSQQNGYEITNFYVAKVRPGKHSLIIPLGAKAKISLNTGEIAHLKEGVYTVEITDISGAFWSKSIEK